MSRWMLYLWVVGVFAASELLAARLGIRFASETLGRLYQYLDPVILREDLLRGLYYLHAQPPLFNAFLGWVLKLFPESYEAVFSLFFGAMALGLLCGMAWLMRTLSVSDVLNGAVCVLFALSPNFLVYRHWLFYTLPIAFLLIAGAVSLMGYLTYEKPGALWAFAGIATAVMMTRSVFHPLWWVAVVVSLVPFVAKARRRRLVLVSLVPLFVVNLWFLKNYLLVGSYAGSTWVGLSLAKRWPLSQKEMAELKASGALPRFWHRRPFQEPRELAPFGFFRESAGTHPALDAPYQTNGEPNFNHRDYVAVSEAMLSGNLYLVLHYPGRYLRRVATAVLLFLQPGPNSVHFLVDYDFERVHRFRDVLTRYVFFGGKIERPIRMFAPKPNLLLVVFPLLLWAGLRGVLRGAVAERGVYAYMLVTVIWVSLVTNLIEIGENDRMRWEIEPFLAIFFAALVQFLWRAWTPRRSAISGEAGRA